MRFSALIQSFRLFFAPQLRPCTVNFHTIDKLGERHFKPNRQTCGFSKRAVFRIEERPSSERDNRLFQRADLFQEVALELSEMSFSVFAKNIGDCPPLAPLDFLIEVDEFPSELFRQAPSNGSFSRAHETDKINATNGHC